MPPINDKVANQFYTPEETAAILAKFGPSAAATGVTPVPVGPSATDLRINKLQDKLNRVLEASKEKLLVLNKDRAVLAAQTAAYDASMAAQANSWVGKTGLNPDGVVGGALNLLSGAIAGGSRQLVGATVAAPFSWDAFTSDMGLSQKHIDAYNRYKTGKHTAADMALLSESRDVPNPSIVAAMPGDVPMDTRPLKTTVLDAIKSAETSRGAARKINDTFNIDSIEHQGSKNKFDGALSGTFQGQWDKITNAYNNDSAKQGIMSRGKDIASGIAGLLVGAGNAAINNKMGVAQYVAENAPQLLLGAFGVVGKTAMAASNVGYAADYYQKGIENFQKDNNGQMPSAKAMKEIAGWAASLAVMEHLGDEIGVNAMKLGKKAVGESAKTGLVQSAKRSLMSALEGGLGETVTEGYQTYAEGRAETAGYTADQLASDVNADGKPLAGKRATAEDIYKSAVIGGLSGGVLSGGVHALSELTGTSEAQVAVRVDKAEKAKVFADAVNSNDPSVYLDPAAPTYNPALAMGVLHQAAISVDATPELKTQNFDKATELMAQMTDKSTELKETIKNGTPAEVKEARVELSKLTPQIADGEVLWDRLYGEYQNTQNAENVAEQVKAANVSVKNADAIQLSQSKESTDSVINLSMASINHVSPEQAEDLASNPENGLNTEQRGFLRAFSEARKSFNAAQDIKTVSKKVMIGDDQDMGIVKYRNQIGRALASNNQNTAEKLLNQLTNFATSHVGKAAAAQEAFDKYGDAGQVYKTANGWGAAAPGTYTTKELREGGQLPIVKPGLLKALKAEAKAVEATREEMAQAVKLKFGAGIPVQTKTAAVQSTTSLPPQKVSAQDHAEDTPRLEVNIPESPQSTPLSPTQATQEVQGTVDDKKATVNNVAAPLSTSSVVPSPSPSPATSVAIAPSLQDGEAAVTKNQTQDTTISTTAMKGQNHEEAARTPSNEAEGQRQGPREGQGQETLQVVPTETIQQEAGEQPANTASAVEAPVAETAPAVEAIAEKAAPGSTYQQKKLGDFFIQGPSILGKVKNFLSGISTPEQAAASIGLSGLTTEQGAALRSFMTHAKNWQETISSNLFNRGKPEYNYEDAMQYFIRPDGDIEENMKTAIAYAVYSYIAENFGGKAYNTEAKINSILGREKSSFVDDDVYREFRDVTASMPAIIEALGSRIVASLGLKDRNDTPVNELQRLKNGLGAHALRVLTDGENPLMVMHNVSPQAMANIRAGDKKAANVGPTTAAQAETYLIINRNADRELEGVAADIVTNNKGSKGIVNELFSIESADKPPTFEPVKKLKAFAKRTEQEVPAFLNKILKALNTQKNFLRLDKLEIMQVLGEELFLKAMGTTAPDATVHVANREPMEARNEGLLRELTNLQTFIKDYLGGDLTKAFYFEHYAMKQQRVGIANSLVNPQLSKIHRFFVYRNSWVSTVNMSDREAMENFVLRAAEGLGIKTEQKERANALAEFKAAFQSDEVQAGIDALNKIHTGEKLSDAEKQAIVTAVGGHGAHGLDALVALAEYDRAKKAKASSFQVNMLAEVDGVTNGPMLSHLLMGAAGSVKDLFSMLNRGGFYESDNAQFNEWRSTAGNQDLYQNTTQSALDMKDRMVASGEILQSEIAPVMYFMGKLKDPITGAVLKAGRDMIKTPLTAMVYGSGIGTAIRGMAGDFIANIYKQMEAAYALRDTDSAAAIKMHEKTVAALKAMGIKVPANTGLSEIMELKFSKSDEDVLIEHFMNTLGKAVDATIRQDFKHLLDIRQRFNATASLTFDMYNAAYEGLRNQLIAELVKSGDIAATSKDNALHDLTPQQEAILDKRMEKITPVLQTAMSNLSGDAHAHSGMLVAKDEMQPSKLLSYTNIVHFAKGFKGDVTKTLTVYARKLMLADPGVSLGATSTHSFDAAVAMSAIGLHNEVLNLHDAGGTGINSLVEHGKRMNKALWDRAISWSPTTEMYESFVRTVQGMETLLADKNTPQEVLVMLGKSIVEQSRKSARKLDDGTWSKPINPQTFLMARALEAKRLSFETNSIKFQAMSQMHSIAQYAIEGGQYDVTDDNRADAVRRLNNETAQMQPQDIKSVQAVQDALQDYIETAMLDAKAAAEAKKAGIKPKEIKTSDIGTLGKPLVNSDQKLVNYFRKGQNRSIQEVAALLKTQNLSGFQNMLLNALVKSLGTRANSYRVNFLTQTSALKDVMELPKGPSHAWFVSKEGKNAIYLLSPDFKESGLTVETLLHEITHAAVAHAIANPTEATRPLIDELEKLREKAAQMVYELKMTHLAPAVESVQEMVAYGMTNPEFQAVLDSFQFTSNNTDNKIISGFKKFIDTLVELVFGKKHDGLSTGFTALVTNVTGLMSVSAKAPASNTRINQSMAAPSLASLNGEEMFDALAALGQTRLSQEFDTHLRAVLNQMDESVHSPLAAMKAAALAQAAQTPMEMWDKMKTAGLANFAKDALASGFHFTEQEAFAQQQVEATVRTALHTKDGSTTAVYRELSRLYDEVRNELKGRISEFHPNTNQAQKLYDFVFKMESGMGDVSDYLSRFAALGLTNHEFSKLLDFNTTMNTKSLSGMTFSERLHTIFENILEWINAKATHTFGGQKADDKLQALVNQLVHIEQTKRMKIAQSAAVAVDNFEKMFRTGFDAARKTADAVATSAFFKKNTNGAIRLAGRITSLVANDRVEQYLDDLQTFRDATLRERQGPMMGILNEGRGAHTITVMYHKLLRMTKHIEGTRKEIMNNTATFVRGSFKDDGSYLTEDIKKALSYGVMRTDIQSLLGPFDIKEIEKLFTDPAALKAAIMNYESKLAGMMHAKAYQNGAKALGEFLATNEVGAENLRLNADNIAAMLGTQFANKLPADVVTAATEVIDPLASLYAIAALDKKYIKTVREVFAIESARTDKGHGIEMMLKLHKDLQKQSQERLFDGSGALRMKGYTPEVHNPYIRIEVANAVDKDATTNKTKGEELEAHGYTPGHHVQMDLADPTYNEKMRIYKLRDGGLVQYLTGIFSYTGMQSRGSTTHNGDLGLLSAGGLMNRAKMDKIARDQLAGIQRQSTSDIDPKAMAKKRNFLVPVFNAQGQVVNYRYMMNAATRDALLERNNDFDHLFGVMAGSIYDKEQTKVQNATAVQALYDQYKQDFSQHPGSYLQVGPNSTDKEAREVWRLLPEDTKQSVRTIWGTNSMVVRYDVLDMNFGYRKNSASTAFGIPEDERDNFQKAYVSLLEGFLGQKAGLYVRRTEEGWQQLVREAKDTMVVKSGMTLLGNFTSNITELIWFGVPLTDIWAHHRTALKGITSYRKDSDRLDKLEQAVRLNHLEGRDPAEVQREIVKLKDSLANNPVKPLIDAGMMPTIVEDVSQEDDRYSYKGQVTKKIDDFVGNMNPHVLKAGKFMMMAHDTPIYKALSYGTQVSDFVARYTLYQHVLNRAKNPIQGEKALQLVSDAFVNYDVPSHRDVQYANDMGLVYFTKYYLRIQKVIALLYKENPGRAMMLLTLGHFLDFIPMLTHSAILQRIGNPFSTGAFEALSSLDELMTVKTLMYPFR